jgi:hypothetical protein
MDPLILAKGFQVVSFASGVQSGQDHVPQERLPHRRNSGFASSRFLGVAVGDRDRQLISVLEDGRFKGQFETGKSGGVLSTDLNS